MADSFDVIVIGGGPAGYPAAIRAAQNKLSVACIDDWKNRDGSLAFGGTCLNAGCIPSKALLESSELYHRAQHEFAAHGVKFDGVGIRRRADAEAQGRDREGHDARHPLAVQGRRRHAAPGPRQAAARPQGRVHRRRRREAHAAGEARGACLGLGADGAAGRRVRRQGRSSIPGARSNSTQCRSACASSAPASSGSSSAACGGDSAPRPSCSRRSSNSCRWPTLPLAKEAQRHFKKQGLDIRLGAKVSGAKVGKDGVHVSYADASGNQSIVVDRVIVAIGRRPYTKDLLARRHRRCARCARVHPGRRSLQDRRGGRLGGR